LRHHPRGWRGLALNPAGGRPPTGTAAASPRRQSVGMAGAEMILQPRRASATLPPGPCEQRMDGIGCCAFCRGPGGHDDPQHADRRRQGVRAPTKLTVSCVNQLDPRRLLLRSRTSSSPHERPEFPAFFDRAYPGGESADGRVQMGAGREVADPAPSCGFATVHLRWAHRERLVHSWASSWSRRRTATFWPGGR